MTDYFSVQLTDDEIRGISSIGLAHMGDGVYELLVPRRNTGPAPPLRPCLAGCTCTDIGSGSMNCLHK